MIPLGSALALILIGILVLWISRRIQRATGLPTGRVVYADTSQWQRTESPMISQRWRLVGRPDYVVSRGREVIPVEVKSGRRPDPPYKSHLLQLAAYCLLVEEWAGRRPSYGLLRYDDAVVEVPFDDALRRRVIEMLAEMRRAAEYIDVPRSHDDPARCRACGVRYACDQRLAGETG
jgi:CRISPR-associated exonuclease Cas4